MKHRVANLELELGHTVWIFDPERGTPIYHAAEQRTTDDGTFLVTRCGRPVWTEQRGGLRSATYLPPKHAVRFARPCATCWPALRNSPSLFKTTPLPRVDTQTAIDFAGDVRGRPGD